MEQVYRILFVVITCFLLCSFNVIAGNNNENETGNEVEYSIDTLISVDFPYLIIEGSRQGVFGNIPGSVSRIDGGELSIISPLSANEAIRSFTGVHLQDEEGAGLRINLGVRGLDPDRSRNILMLEDGIPVALKPYGEPEMYFSPSIERMSGIELLKGSGQILYGPQTIGGVLNYITADPPETTSGRIRVNAGGGGYFSGIGSIGSSAGNAGFNLNYLFKRADRIGHAGFDIHDINGKFKFDLSHQSSLSLKLGIYKETSNSTYLGLTQTMFDQGGQDHVRMAPDDRLNVSRESASLVHNWKPSDRFSLSTTVFGYTVTRDWRRQDFSSDPDASDQTGVVWGDPSIPGGAVFMQNSTGNRNRSFEVAGLEPRIQYTYGSFLEGNHQLRAGARFMFERAFEQRINGSKSDAGSGVLRNDEIRTGLGYSVYAQNRFNLTSRWTLTAGLRMEHYAYEREILRAPFGGQIRDTSLVNNSSVTSLIPGLGFNYKIDEQLTFFGGIHRGFSPPRVKDAISATGEVVELDAELSWNSELGLRYRGRTLFSGEFTAFLMDFSNQIIPVSESAGGSGSGLINAGETRHLGIEGAIGLDFGQLLPDRFQLQMHSSITYVQSEFTSDRYFMVEGEQVNARGNRTPYAPEIILHQEISFRIPAGIGLRLGGHFTGDHYTDVLNTETPSPNGRDGKIESYFNLDGNLFFDWQKKGIMFNISAKNLTDERYIVSRRPQGIRVSTPRLITAGIDWRF